VSAGANVKAVQRMLGHASKAMTLDLYSDLFDYDLTTVGQRGGDRPLPRRRRAPSDRAAAAHACRRVISVGSSRSGRDQDALAQQVELRPAIHLSLDHLVAVDGVLGGAANTVLLGEDGIERAVRRRLS
jgi:hypothetical protein